MQVTNVALRLYLSTLPSDCRCLSSRERRNIGRVSWIRDTILSRLVTIIKRLVHHAVYCMSLSCLLSFLYNPYIPFLIYEIFHLLVIIQSTAVKDKAVDWLMPTFGTRDLFMGVVSYYCSLTLLKS